MAETSDPTFFGENRSLFSDYYLAERLTDLPEWSADVSEPFQRALEIYQENKALLPEMKEAQTEKEFIQPILSEVLGFEYDVQRSEKRSGRVNIPDYILFGNRSALKKAQAHRNEPGKYYSDALALSDAKYWERPLDGTGVAEKDRLTNANPSFQIVSYLTATGLDWGILTNGSQWRLYSMKSRSRIDSYFEVNLQQILDKKDQEQFKYFYHFFRAKAFRKDPETGQHFLGSVFSGSIDYGTRLEGRLKELIFEDVFLTLAKGFTEFRANEARNDPETDESLQEIYQGTLRLLYRLLFLLHAESRGLLPVDEPKGYYQHSLMKLKREIARKMDSGEKLSTASNNIWNDLVGLFRIIDRGDAALNVPRYNGGLFRNDHPKNEFLNDHSMVDQYIVPALELLTREPDPKTGRKRFIDYKSLNVEQLGSIYEGLLEFHLRIARKPLAVVKKRGREVFEPEKEVDDPSQVIKKGELYLENDKGERKATGSYYTPHYIVEYIVEHTLGPVFDKRAKTFEDLMDRLEPKYEEYSKLNQKIEEGDRSERTHNKRKGLHLEIESLENKATEALLSIKICDPAMGSGHFLKEATDKLAEKIITLLAQYPLNPVTKLLGSVRKDILASLDEQDITIDAEEHLKDTNLIKRMVMKRSIYGVDLNPMAVELAKLSLWLDSFTVGAPLSFLDHHLKTGNSLIGTTVGEVKDALTKDTLTEHGLAGQLFQGGPFVGMLKATGFMHEVAVQTDATIAEIEKSLDSFSEYENAIDPYKQILDLWISQHFGNERAQNFVRSYGEDVLDFIKGNRKPNEDSQKKIFDETQSISTSKQFFHWELEFPEVFIDLKQGKWLENPGFDAVVGNPPYIQIQTLKEIDEKAVSFFNNTFDAAGGNYDLYVLFTEKGLRLLRSEGRSGFILPNKFFRVDYGEGLRELFSQGGHVADIIDFGSEQVFPNTATTYTALLFLEGTQISNEFKYRKIKSDHDPSTLGKIKEAWTTEKYLKSTIDSSPWNFHSAQTRNLINTVDSISNQLGYYTDSIARGISTGDDDVFVLQVVEKQQTVSICHSQIKNSSFPIETELLRTPIHSTDFQKYQYDKQAEKVLLWPYDETSNYQLRPYHEIEEKFPEAAAYFQDCRSLLEDRAQYSSWQGYSAPRSLAVHDSAEIIIPLLADKPSFTAYPKLQKNFMLMASGGFSISLKADTDIDPYYVLSLINTDLLFFYLRTLSNIFRGGYVTCTKQYFKQLPIRKIDFNTPNAERKQYVQDLVNLYQEKLSVFDTVHSHLTGESERLDVIHDFLAFLAKQMLEFNEEKQRLQSALDPFKFLNKGVAFKPFTSVFSEAIKYGEQLAGDIDIGTAHHDIEGLRLEPEGEKWLLKLQLKHRDSETDWEDWIKEDGNIVRSTQSVYRFELSDNQARYWQQAFEVQDEFKNSSTFPGGKTRTTHEKLMKTKVPVFDDSANIEPLIELREELAKVKGKIEKTDWLIDQVVYQLYGLSDEEIGVVEGSIN